MWLVGALVVPGLLAASAVGARAWQVGGVEGAAAPAAGRFVVLPRGDEVVLSGGATDDGERLALVDAVRAGTASVRGTDLITPGGERMPVDRDRVREASTAWSAVDLTASRRSITAMVEGDGGFRFEPGAATRQGHGPVLVDRVGRLLLVAPRTAIALVGHASAEHPDAEAPATARACAVRDRFVAQGVRPDRIGLSASVDPVSEGAEPSARQVDVLLRDPDPRSTPQQVALDRVGRQGQDRQEQARTSK
ncbi:hypothetical protein [Saccharothrix yanglingensis]|uniref:OmpA-like domain-containing protein n=1 Tax=Saccharothrix yanglingensis TaxID=659496 RepID=A0ABU0WWD7_9PSEU|nr:hypothetical protein [Saccharothrix yanglingensis]MDQ2584173.1 hypothetical protein [Saccharothrix yanglingensis]